MIEKNWKKNILRTGKINKIQIPASINKVLLEYSQAHMVMYCLWFIWHLQLRNWIVVMELYGSQNLKDLLCDPLQ